ncbi:MAG: SPOR domain-containing protein [Bacteroidales bacterium]|nr:SPOR domain-containing protein [Bacteroidales bacterium]
MRRVLPVIVLVLSVAFMATGCDFFRVLAGRPTSKDIEAKRELILRSSEQPVSTGQAEAKPDTVVAAPSRPAGDKDPSTSSGAGTGKKRFYVIMGAFSSRENAEKYAARIKGFGYEPEFFGFTEGRTAVGIGGTDDQEEAKAFMKELKGQDFCPEGVWILDRKKK